ncbi:MAG: hypothetical protein AAGH41_02935 [Pseudomonadota bacterium]
MKRAQINRHRLTWLIMGPVLFSLIAAAVMVRPAEDDATNGVLPTFLTQSE